MGDDGDARSFFYFVGEDLCVDWGWAAGSEVGDGGVAFPVVLFWRCCKPRGPTVNLGALTATPCTLATPRFTRLSNSTS